jgi:hypothetical protein
MGKFETKTEMIKNHLLDGKSITSWEAIHLYQCTRLAAVKKYLEERDDIVIESKMIYEDGTKYARYWLTSDPKIKEEIKDFLLRGNRLTEELAKEVFDCDHIKVVINELREEGMNILCETVHPLCGKKFNRYYFK